MNASVHALFPGTFDPVTFGHLDVLERAARLFSKVTVLVASHHDKRSLFSTEERVQLWREATATVSAAQIEVQSWQGLLVEAARELEAQVVVRGVRNLVDLEYERSMALTNRELYAEMETVFLLPDPRHGHVSSTLVRQISGLDGDVSGLVPAPVVAALAARS